MKIYIAAPLFNETELERNRLMRDFLHRLGFETYLPQEDGGISYDLIKSGAPVEQTRKKIFDNDMQEIKVCGAMLCILDGRVPDEGVCVELGAAYALGKPCVGYLTDKRTLDEFGPSLMIEGCLKSIAHSQGELKELLLQLPHSN
jgi:nucleoside 2-deoxyribosyltransferase